MLRILSRFTAGIRPNVNNIFLHNCLNSIKIILFFEFQFPLSWNISREFASKNTDDSDIVHLEDNPQITIPEYPDRPDEPLESRRQR